MILDTDCVIRFLTNDDSEKAKRFELFLRTTKETLKITDVTFAEIYWTLSSFYEFPKEKTLLVLTSLMSHKNISANKEVLLMTIKFLKKYNLSFIDSYEAVLAIVKDGGKIMSFDKGFDRIKEITRVEP